MTNLKAASAPNKDLTGRVEMEELAPVLDVCCGTKMMWFNKDDERCLYVDKRNESFRPIGRKFADKDVFVSPDIQADFTDLPFPSDSFSLVVFDPPHIARQSVGNVTRYCGSLPVEWRDMLRAGFTQCFRVLRPNGVLIFKWSEVEIPLRDVLALTDQEPLFGHRSGKAAKTHWVCFIKPQARCIWTEETDPDGIPFLWNTGCGSAHEFNTGGPEENAHFFCPYCGKPLEISYASEKEG